MFCSLCGTKLINGNGNKGRALFCPKDGLLYLEHETGLSRVYNVEIGVDSPEKSLLARVARLEQQRTKK